MIESSERRNIDSLSLDITTLSDSGRVFSWTSIVDSSDENIDWVLSSLEIDNLKSLFDNSNSLEFLTGVSSVELKGSDKSLDNWHSGFSELSELVSSSSVGNVYLALSFLNGNEILKGNVLDYDLVIIPFSK